LMVVPGVDIVGALPAEIQTAAIFSAGMLAGTAQAEAAGALLRFLGSPDIAPVLRATGLEPATG
jgi:molybdate transport system substrate-binding protein